MPEDIQPISFYLYTHRTAKWLTMEARCPAKSRIGHEFTINRLIPAHRIDAYFIRTVQLMHIRSKKSQHSAETPTISIRSFSSPMLFKHTYYSSFLCQFSCDCHRWANKHNFTCKNTHIHMLRSIDNINKLLSAYVAEVYNFLFENMY